MFMLRERLLRYSGQHSRDAFLKVQPQTPVLRAGHSPLVVCKLHRACIDIGCRAFDSPVTHRQTHTGDIQASDLSTRRTRRSNLHFFHNNARHSIASRHVDVIGRDALPPPDAETVPALTLSISAVVTLFSLRTRRFEAVIPSTFAPEAERPLT